MSRERLRIAYLSGPVDGVDVFNKWQTRQKLGYFGASHLTNFFEVCAACGAEAYVITTLGGQYRNYRTEQFVIENRPQPSKFRGLTYHIAQTLWLMRMLPKVLLFRPHVFVITAAQNYWFLFAVLKLWRIKIIPAITCTLWPQFTPLRRSLKILLRLNGWFFAHCADAFMVVSNDIAVQVRTLMPNKTIAISRFRPTYLRDQFSCIGSTSHSERPFRIFFAGRIEQNKGVFDLLEIARDLERKAPSQFCVDICGDGSELERLRRKVIELGLSKMVVCHGLCGRAEMTSLLSSAHVVIVPTTTQFEEGFNKVCAEAVLAGRPVVTSSVCPALADVRAAACEVKPDDVKGYCGAIFELFCNRKLYEQKRNACEALQEQFYDPENSWGGKFSELLSNLLPAIDSRSKAS